MNALDGPYEPPVQGQEREPPEVRLAVLVALALLLDVRRRLERERDAESLELLLRLGAVLAVLRRVRDRLEDEGG